MNKKLLIGTVVGLGVAGCAAACARAGTCRRDEATEPKPTVWDKMRKGLEEMPEDFPPRIMFDDIEKMRANTDEILSLLKERSLVTT